MPKVDDILNSIASTKAKVLELQSKVESGGMTAEEEARVEAALTDLSQTADPKVPNPS